MQQDFSGLIGGSNECSDECMVISIVPFNGIERTVICGQKRILLRAIRFVFEAGAGAEPRI
jgi:hypothetical protein